MNSIFILLTFLLILRQIGGLSKCNRTPDGILRSKNPDGTKYIIEIPENPTSYVAGANYTVYLKGNPILEGKHMFKEFILSVEHENEEKQLDLGHTRVGYFKLADRQLTKFSGLCENTITQTNSVSKDSIQVDWVAPPTGSGCVAFRATVVESKESWYSEDGLLTMIMCEEVSENEDLQPEVLDKCCACDEAKYELVFEGLWTRNTHPKDYPSNIWYTKFGDIVGASHGNDQSFWKYEDAASQNLKILGERGDTRSLEKELKEKMGKSVRTIIKANGLRYPNITGKTFAFFRVDSKNHLVSIVTKVTPSPDWILGVSNFELCHEDCTWTEQRVLNLYPWDIGTDDGPSYNSPNEPVAEPRTIQKIVPNNDPNSPFYDLDGREMKPFAKLSLTRLKTYKKECSEDQETTMDPSETTTEGGCKTTEWSEWSPCSVTCGKGMKYQERQFVNPEDEEECKNDHPLRLEDICNMGKCFLPTDDTRCELTEWGEWSTCSATCGRGTKTRDKKFKDPQFAELCELNDPSHLQENNECDTKNDTCEEDPPEDPRCLELRWGYWSICNVTCGEGVKTRLRSLENDEKEEIEQLGCKNMEIVTCYEPQCVEGGEEPENNVGGMDIFNQVTTDVYSQPVGPVANCKVSEYSIWGPCEPLNGKCGRGWTYQHRQILQHQMNGGKPCPRKLMRKKRCNVSCNPEKTEEPLTTKPTTEETIVASTEPAKPAEDEPVDCIMSDWSQWSPCSFNCGDSAVQQRTRSIRVYPKNGGKPCGPRLDEKPCSLPLACNDKGVSSM